VVFRVDTVQERLLRLEEVISELQGLAGFRNILVHEYIRLDPDRVEEALAKAPHDFTDFALAVRRWLEGRSTPEEA
jgi:uncharacterized protein YutE (UPF0331/DUF86 family)